MTSQPISIELDLDALRRNVTGPVLVPGDDGYDGARLLFPGQFDHRPDAVVRAADADDVARAVAAAGRAGLPLAVKSGGHGPAGHGVSNGGLTLDLSAMDALKLDLDGNTAWAEPGVTAGAYIQAAGAHGLVTGFGDTPSVGVGGITLAGGIGYLVRAFGLTIDDLLAADVVTADGELHHVDEDHDPDLFWAVRGGGGNVGVATRFRFRLRELPAVAGGVLILPATPETIVGFLERAEAAPDALSTIANVMPAPPMPFLPEEVHGRLSILGLMMYAGDPDPGMKELEAFRALATPYADMLRPMTYPEIYFPQEEDYHPIAVGRTNLTDATVDLATAGVILDRIASSSAVFTAVQLRVLGGAMARVPADATAFAPRTRGLMVTAAAMAAAPEGLEELRPWVEDVSDLVAGTDRNAYTGFLGDEGEERVRSAYPGVTWERLAKIKARYDPTNLFRGNQNVPPA